MSWLSLLLVSGGRGSSCSTPIEPRLLISPPRARGRSRLSLGALAGRDGAVATSWPSRAPACGVPTPLRGVSSGLVAPAAVATPAVERSTAAAPSFDVAAPAGAASPLETPRSGVGTPQAGARLGHDVATAPSLPASAPRLNLDLPRARGGEISSRGSMGLLQLLPRPPETKSKLSQDIEKAAKPDCRNAYAGLGLLAAIRLAVDAARDKGCEW